MSGWYPDPTGRFEYRYHNDQVWTADVSSSGQRFVDPLPTSLRLDADGRNGLAVAGMVCGIAAVATTWIPFVVVVGVIAGDGRAGPVDPGPGPLADDGQRTGLRHRRHRDQHAAPWPWPPSGSC